MNIMSLVTISSFLLPFDYLMKLHFIAVSPWEFKGSDMSFTWDTCLLIWRKMLSTYTAPISLSSPQRNLAISVLCILLLSASVKCLSLCPSKGHSLCPSPPAFHPSKKSNKLTQTTSCFIHLCEEFTLQGFKKPKESVKTN